MIPGLTNRRRFRDLSEQEILALAISFMANSFFSLRNSTFHTLPNPPRPTT